MIKSPALKFRVQQKLFSYELQRLDAFALVGNIERFQVRETQAIITHIFGAIRGFVQWEFLRFKALIVNWYS